MRKYGFLFLVISVLFGQSTIPNTKVRLLNNETVNLNALTNGVSIVSFWATWCIPCVKEIYAIEKLIQESEKVNCDKRLNKLLEIEKIAAKSIPYVPIWISSQKAWSQIKISKPTFNGAGIISLSDLKLINE